MSLPSGSGGGSQVVLKLYRDCLRLIRHVAPGTASPKSKALRATVRGEFKHNMHLRDPGEIEAAQASAVRALSNYLLATSAPNDAKLRTAAQDYHSRSVREAKAQSNSSNISSSSNSSAAENEVGSGSKE